MSDRLREPPPLQVLVRLSCYPWLIVGTTCIGAFIGQLDASIVQLALPAFEREFNASLSAVSWVAISYLLAFAVVLPVFARLSEMFGRKLLYLGGYALFTIASALCGMVSDLTLLIGLRVLQGIGGALLGANSITILLTGAGESRKGRAMGIFAAAQAVGVSAGPALGGLLLVALDWRWVFWVSVPFGLAAMVIGWFVLPQTTDLSSDKHFDWWGAWLLTPALISIIIVLSEFQALGPTSPALVGAIVIAAILLPLFVRHEQRTRAPLIEPALFRVPAFAGGVIAVNLSYALLYAMFFLMSFAFVRGYGDSPLVAGLRLAIIPVALGLVAPLSGAIYERIGPRLLTTAGMAICLIALLLLSLTLASVMAHRLAQMAALALLGVGLGMFIAPNNSATVSAAPHEKSGEAGGLLNLMRVLGGSVGVAVASSVLSWRLQVRSGTGDSTLAVSHDTLLGAVNDVLPVLAAFAFVAGAVALVRSHHRVRPTVPVSLHFH